MIDRTKDFWLVALFLSRFTDYLDGKPVPPTELNTTKWRDAYRSFYESLGKGRSVDSFELSLRNARDTFDGHFDTSPRVGWRDRDGNPERLIRVANAVFEIYNSKSRADIWEEINTLADITVKNYQREFDDLSAIQNMELSSAGQKISLTEGGTKILISVVYERNSRLRSLAFKAHGHICAVCAFDFTAMYGDWGKGFAEVHHIVPVSEFGENKRAVDPEKDLIVVCSNCHRMMHRKKGITLTVGELKAKIKTCKLMGKATLNDGKI